MSNTLILGSPFFKEYILLGELLKVNKIYNLNDFEYYFSTSSSSIIIFLLSINKSIFEIIHFFYISDFFINLDHILNNQKLDVYNIINIKSKLTKYIENEFYIVPTMEQLFLMTGKTISFTCEDEDGEIIEISHYNYPNLSCIDAMILSLICKGIYEKPNFLQLDDLKDCSFNLPLKIKCSPKSELVVCVYLKFSSEPIGQFFYDSMQIKINHEIDKIVNGYKNIKLFHSKIYTNSFKNLEFIEIMKQDIKNGYLSCE